MKKFISRLAAAVVALTMVMSFAGCGEDKAVPAPKFSVASGEVEKGTKVAITTTVKDAAIYYTTDETTPTRESNLYTEEIEINSSVTIRAFAVKEGLEDSKVSEVIYIVQGPDTKNVTYKEMNLSAVSKYSGFDDSIAITTRKDDYFEIAAVSEGTFTLRVYQTEKRIALVEVTVDAEGKLTINVTPAPEVKSVTLEELGLTSANFLYDENNEIAEVTITKKGIDILAVGEGTFDLTVKQTVNMVAKVKITVDAEKKITVEVTPFEYTTLTGTVTITGEAKVGKVLKATYNGNAPESCYYFRWYIDGVKVSEMKEYTVTNEDAGKKIKVSAFGTDMYKGEIFSEETAAVEQGDPADAGSYLAFTADTEFAIGMVKSISISGSLQYSTDGIEWNVFYGTVLSKSGSDGKHHLYLRGKGHDALYEAKYAGTTYLNLKINKAKVSCSGNIMALLDYENTDTVQMGEYAFRSLFKDCTNLASAPDLPAEKVAKYAYNEMFSGCTLLVNPPVMGATEIADYGCQDMFKGCTSLEKAPSMSVTTVGKSSMSSMFSGCTALKEPVALPATTLADSCYNSMFFNCTSLTSAPALPATETAKSCYMYMFSKCTSLATAPALPATTITESCYSHMFEECTSLTAAPALPATTVAKSSYQYMFGSSGITEAPALPATTLGEYCYSNMFYKTPITKAPELPATTLAKNCYDTMFSRCENLTEAPALPATELAEKCYSQMFLYAKALTKAPELKAETLAAGCYYYMFNGCSALETVQATLPAKNVLKEAYKNMFTECTALTTAPTVEAEVIGESGCENMFKKTGITSFADLKATEVGKRGCSGMLEETAIENPPALPATTIGDYCYEKMFYKCASLTKSPELPATEIAYGCYSQMFSECKALKTAPTVLPAANMAGLCYSSMFLNCVKLTTAPVIKATDSKLCCLSSMFEGCKSLYIYSEGNQPAGYVKVFTITDANYKNANNMLDDVVYNGKGNGICVSTGYNTDRITKGTFYAKQTVLE